VVGATGHVSPGDIRRIRELAGQDVVFLIPGVGSQGGDAKKVLSSAGENALVNASRSINYGGDPKKSAKELSELLNGCR